MLKSDYRKLCAVKLPYHGRQMYMHTFDIAHPVMAPGYEDYLIPVCALLNAAGADSGIAHMTVDEKVVKAGESQRRPHPHVDGCFYPNRAAVKRIEDILDIKPPPRPSWGHDPKPAPLGGWGHQTSGWLHTCNNVPGEDYKRMPVIVASNVPGCRAWKGIFRGSPKEDGDLSHLGLSSEDGEVLPAGFGYLLSPDCIHESMIQSKDVKRTFLRIALPTDFIF